MLDVILEQPLGERFVMMALRNTDERITKTSPCRRVFFRPLLWHEVLAAWKKAEAEGLRMIPALYQAMDQVVAVQAEKLAIPRRFTTDMKEIWVLQPRLLQRGAACLTALLEHPRFRAGFRFSAVALRERRSRRRGRRNGGTASRMPARKSAPPC